MTYKTYWGSFGNEFAFFFFKSSKLNSYDEPDSTTGVAAMEEDRYIDHTLIITLSLTHTHLKEPPVRMSYFETERDREIGIRNLRGQVY